MSTLLIPDPAINRFARMATMEAIRFAQEGFACEQRNAGDPYALVSVQVPSTDYEESKVFVTPTKEDIQRTSESKRLVR